LLGWLRSILSRLWSMDHMDWRRVVRLVDQDWQLMVRQWNILDCRWRIVASTSSITSIRVRRLWWRREMNDRRLFS
jgi:hypothetical protein